ncbi:MAG: cell wall metabolism sensor histidine kinase WalK [Anaeromicrobium sp.]|jgi:two-component system sensor histidine kinase VicK|uniref:ATP-binding protein n=1 Tax=Anaeromicrobium sp. TaxID=1929132 RepID=UPI0025D20644|nr:ATP-binding protein [Anaeromicrobium sp.]MCT4594312.1 cell wall metabolism sensor histidine kinase WalK [Anaeromicrobium sp.]
MFKSIRWKFITIYFLPVYIAMLIVSVFIIQQFQEYQLNMVSENLNNLGRQEGLIKTIARFEDLNEYEEDIQRNIDQWPTGLKEEVFIVNMDFKIIARSKNSGTNKDAIDILDYTLLTEARNGKTDQKDIYIESRNIVTKNMAFPIQLKGGQPKGILYIRADLSDVYKGLEKAKIILIQGTILALFITVILGFLIGRSITEPIIDVTKKASKMARGDFNQVVEVKSDDEIGQLAEMFNYVRAKLNVTLSQISSEKSKLETILSYMADGLIAVNNYDEIIHANPTAMEMLGLKEEDIKNKSYNEIMNKLNENLSLKYIQKNRRLSNYTGKETLRIGDSILSASYAPYMDEKGRKAGVVMVLQDITKRQELDNMRKEFVANVSHELKTPLTSIKSYTETLLDGALEEKDLAVSFLQVVNSEADRMNGLVRDLLQLSRLDSKKVLWNKKNSNLVKIGQDAVNKMEITAQNKNQTLSFITKNQFLSVYVDKDRIEQVIINIISNAIKYTPSEGHIQVKVYKDKNYAVASIKDNGIGIPKKAIPRLFERFYRVDKARSREMGGTGLGLSIAKQIVVAHDGEIFVESKEGMGTEVFIKIPINKKKD